MLYILNLEPFVFSTEFQNAGFLRDILYSYSDL